MANSPDPADRVGWELIWRSGDIPERYRGAAPPNGTVVEWAAMLASDSRVLDVGCGAGRHCLYLAGRGCRVAGVDIAPSSIKLTEEVCAAQQIAFDGRVSDMTTLPWPDNTFDGALSIATIHHHLRPNIVRSLGEVWRVLKPGGLFLADFLSTDRDDYQVMRDMVTAGQIVEVEPNTFVDERPDSPDPDGFLPHHYCDEADLRDLLRPFDLIKLWAAPPERGTGLVGKWVAWARKPLSQP